MKEKTERNPNQKNKNDKEFHLCLLVRLYKEGKITLVSYDVK